MTDINKARAQGFLFGAAAGLGILAAALFLIVTPKTRAQASELATTRQQLETQKQREGFAIVQQINEDLKNCDDRIAVATQQQSSGAGYTALIEPAPAAGNSALHLFDVLRPGLGTLLAKLQSTQTQPIATRWVISGHVRPMTNSAGYTYCWLSAAGEADPANCPAVTP